LAGNRERIQRLALEAELTAEEKAREPKLAAKKSRTRKSAALATGGRLKKVWTVFDRSHVEVESFPFPSKTEAETLAAELSEETGAEYFVREQKVPL